MRRRVWASVTTMGIQPGMSLRLGKWFRESSTIFSAKEADKKYTFRCRYAIADGVAYTLRRRLLLASFQGGKLMKVKLFAPLRLEFATIEVVTTKYY